MFEVLFHVAEFVLQFCYLNLFLRMMMQLLILIEQMGIWLQVFYVFPLILYDLFAQSLN